MRDVRGFFNRWGPALLWMAVLFAASATPSSDIPTFGLWDFVVKKGGHMLGYAVLALLYRRALGWDNRKAGLAWLLAVLYAMTDEWHQTLVPGRHPEWFDVLIFDGGGAAIAMLAAWAVGRLKVQPQRQGEH